MRKKYRIELFAEIILDSNRLLDEDDIMKLADPKIVIKQYEKTKEVFAVNFFELKHNITNIGDEDDEEVIEV